MNTVGFICGTFDFLHPGHLSAVQIAQSRCQQLIIGLQSNPTIDRPDTKLPPTQSLYTRFAQLRAILRPVDILIPYDTETDLVNILLLEPITIRFVGEEYRDTPYTGHNITTVGERTIQTVFIPRQGTYRSSQYKS